MNDDDLDNDDSQSWIPEPPDDDDDDPNPRAMPAPAPRAQELVLAPVIPIRRKVGDSEASLHLAEALKLVGVRGVLGDLLDATARDVNVPIANECPTCKHVMAPYYRHCPKCEGDRNRQKVDRIAELVRELKAIAVQGDPNPSREREILHQLREYDHPDLDGLTRWCMGARDRVDRSGAKSPPVKPYQPKGPRW